MQFASRSPTMDREFPPTSRIKSLSRSLQQRRGTWEPDWVCRSRSASLKITPEACASKAGPALGRRLRSSLRYLRPPFLQVRDKIRQLQKGTRFAKPCDFCAFLWLILYLCELFPASSGAAISKVRRPREYGRQATSSRKPSLIFSVRAFKVPHSLTDAPESAESESKRSAGELRSSTLSSNPGRRAR